MPLKTRIASYTVAPSKSGATLSFIGEYFDDGAPLTVIYSDSFGPMPAAEFDGMTANQAKARINAILDGWGVAMKAVTAKATTADAVIGPLVGLARAVA